MDLGGCECGFVSLFDGDALCLKPAEHLNYILYINEITLFSTFPRWIQALEWGLIKESDKKI